jgi:hypothetical protein
MVSLLFVLGTATVGLSCGKSAPPTVDVTGTWLGTATSDVDGSSLQVVLGMKQEDAAVSAQLGLQSLTSWNANTSNDFTGTVEGAEVTLDIASDQGDPWTFTATVSGESATGTYSITLYREDAAYTDQGTWSVKRVPASPLTSTLLFSVDADIGAMTFDGTHLWLDGSGLDPNGANLCKFTLQGDRVACFDTPNPPYDGVPAVCSGAMTFDGTNLRCRNRNPDGRLYVIDTNGAFVSQVSTTHADGALAWDGQTLWCAQDVADLESLDAAGNALSTIQISLPHPSGLAWDGESLWLADEPVVRIYRLDRTGKVLGVSDPPPMTSAQRLTALAWDGARLLVSIAEWTNGTARSQIYALEAK